MLNAQPTERSRFVTIEKSASVTREPIQLSRSLVEFLYSLLVGAGAFLLFFSFGYWLFADAGPETAQIGGWILGPLMGLLLFVFAWGYFGQRQRLPR